MAVHSTVASVFSLNRQFKVRSARAMSANIHGSATTILPNTYVLSVDTASDVNQIVQSYAADPNVALRAAELRDDGKPCAQ